MPSISGKTVSNQQFDFVLMPNSPKEAAMQVCMLADAAGAPAVPAHEIETTLFRLAHKFAVIKKRSRQCRVRLEDASRSFERGAGEGECRDCSASASDTCIVWRFRGKSGDLSRFASSIAWRCRVKSGDRSGFATFHPQQCGNCFRDGVKGRSVQIGVLLFNFDAGIKNCEILLMLNWDFKLRQIPRMKVFVDLFDNKLTLCAVLTMWTLVSSIIFCFIMIKEQSKFLKLGPNELNQLLVWKWTPGSSGGWLQFTRLSVPRLSHLRETHLFHFSTMSYKTTRPSTCPTVRLHACY